MLQTKYFKQAKDLNEFLAQLDAKDIVRCGIKYLGQESRQLKDEQDNAVTVSVPINTFELVYQVRNSSERAKIKNSLKEKTQND